MNWRDLIKIHPACTAIPDMEPDQFDQLVADVRKRGNIVQPIVKWRGGDAEPWQLLDGRHRLDALSLLDDGPEKVAAALDRCVYKGPETDPWHYSRSVNVARRHLDAEQKRQVIATLVQADPTRSNRAVAKDADSNHHTVARVRNDLEGRGTVSRVSMRTDAVGRQQPAHRQQPAAVVHNTTPQPEPESVVGQFRAASSPAALRPAPSVVGAFSAGGSPGAGAPPTPAGPQPSPSLKRDTLVGDVCGWLRADLRGALDSLVLILRDEQSSIADLPLDKRIILARGYLQALSVTADDLKKAVL
jgi:hypothetical protein